MNNNADDHRWLQMLGLLTAVSSHLMAVDADARWISTQAERKRQDAMRNAMHVDILERLSPTSVVVGWTDATSGRYGDQIWSLRIARRKGVCALSGEPFLRGDPIYRTNARRRTAANAEQSISAAAIARLEEGLGFPRAREP
jgi:hypothetical protein